MQFEKTLAELKKIVEKLENKSLSMDESLALYKEGLELSKACEKELADLKGKIEILNSEFEPVDGEEEDE